MQPKKISALGLITLLLVGCSTGRGQVIEVMHTPLDKALKEVAIYLNEEQVAGSYEPEQGVYVGADAEHNTLLEEGMTTYEALLGKEQTFRVFQYSERGDVTSRQILECIAEGQTPYIKVLPDEQYDLMPIYHMIGDLNTRYPSVLFIELFPLQTAHDEPDKYKAYYEDAYQLIKKYIDETVVVWSVNWEQVYDTAFYYPGNHMVDWVGLNITLPKFKAGEVYSPQGETAIAFWYDTFQNEKPLIVSTLAISHFSKVDHCYTVEDTKNKLNYFYTEMLDTYPRIKGILYSDVAMYELSATGEDDYRVTSQQQLIDHMARLQDQPTFLSTLQESEALVYKQPVKYTVQAYRIEDMYYVQADQLSQLEVSQSLLRDIPYLIDVDGQKYYMLEVLVQEKAGYIAPEPF